MKPKLIVMCGISGSGKSTWARGYVEEDPWAVIVSTDVIREYLFGDCRVQKDGDKVFQIAYNCIGVLLREGRDVIFDAMSLKPKDRLTLMMQFDAFAEMICVVTGNDRARALENQYKRDRQVPEKVVRAQSKRFVMPTKEEGWDEIVYVR